MASTIDPQVPVAPQAPPPAGQSLSAGDIHKNVMELRRRGVPDETITKYLYEVEGVGSDYLPEPDPETVETQPRQPLGQAITQRLATAGQHPEEAVGYYQQKDPSARVWTPPEGVPGAGEKQVVIFNPQENRYEYANPAGFDVGDVPGSARTIAEVVAGYIGEKLVPTKATAAVSGAAAGQLFDLLQAYTTGRMSEVDFLDQAERFGIDLSMGYIADRLAAKGFKIAKEQLGKGWRSMFGDGRRPFSPPGEDAASRLEDFRSAGVKSPPAGAVSQNLGVQRMENSFMDNPVTAEKMKQHIGQSIEDTAASADRLARRFGPVRSREQAGKELRKAIPGATKKIKDKQDVLYRRAEDVIGRRTMVDISNTLDYLRTAVDKMKPSVDGGRGLKRSQYLIDELRELEKKAPDGKIEYGALKDWKTRTGEAIDQALFQGGDVGMGQRKAYYDAWKQDQIAAAEAVGVGNQMRAANKYTENIYDRQVPLLEEISRKGYDEDAWKLIENLVMTGRGQKLIQLRRQILRDDKANGKNKWGAIVSTVLDRMGKTTFGNQNELGTVWSPEVFLTNWNRLNQLGRSARQALFEYDPKLKVLAPQLDRLARMSSYLKESAKRANKSGTSGSMWSQMLLMQPLINIMRGSPIKAAQSVAWMIMTPKGASRLFRSNAYLKWLARAERMAKEGKPARLSRHILRGYAIAESEGDPTTQRAMYEYFTALDENMEKAEDIGVDLTAGQQRLETFLEGEKNGNIQPER